MPRAPRVCPGQVVYHVLNRSVARIKLFRRPKDYIAFEKVLHQAQERLPIELFAYCVMPTHWHLVLRPREDGHLTSFIQWLTLTHVQRWRAAHQTVGYGPLYQGRFKAFPIQEDGHLLTVLRYVERNPLRAGFVQHARDWQWSSVARRLAPAKEQPQLATWPVEAPPDLQQWIDLPQTSKEEHELTVSIRRSKPFGHPNWQFQTARKHGTMFSLRPIGRPAAGTIGFAATSKS